MKLYRVDVKIAGTAYIKARTEREALRKARALKDMQIGLDGEPSDVEISGLQFGNPELPEVSLSPVMTCHGLWGSVEFMENLDVAENSRSEQPQAQPDGEGAGAANQP